MSEPKAKEFLEWLKDREKTLIEVIGKSHAFSATFVSELEDLRPIIDKAYELLQPSTPDPKARKINGKSNLNYILTVEEIKEKGPCKEGYEWVLANAVNGVIDRAAILEHRKDWEHWITANGLCSPVVSSGGLRSTVYGGHESTLSGGRRSTVTGGYRSTVSGGDRSTVSGGDESTVTGGDRSTVYGGDRSTVSGGLRSTVYGGYRSVLILLYWNDDRFEYQAAVVGKDGIKPETKYKLDDNNQFAEAADEQ